MPTNIKKTCLNINCPERNGGECTAEPTNNQEKWIEEFMHRFAGDNRSDGMGWKLHLEVIDFLRQEIRQAKIEALENLIEINHAFDWGVYDPFVIIRKEISNLKQNDNTTKN